MKATRSIPDDIIEAIVHDEPVHTTHAQLVAFARHVRGLGDGPVPRASDELAALLEGREPARLGPVDARGRRAAADPGGRPVRLHRVRGVERIAGLAGKVAGLGLVAKVGLGTSLAAASAAGAGAVGVLPTPANDAVRDVIEAVTPVEFQGEDDPPANFGDQVSDDATGESDGTPGVDGPSIADDAPGAAHRPGGSDVADEPPGQPSDTGLTRANETPAAPHAPDSVPHGPGSVPSTVPAGGEDDDPGAPDDPGPGSDPGPTPGPVDGSVPSTVPPQRLPGS